MDAVGILGLVLAVSKELYTYYKGIKHCDDDIKAFREQLLSLQAICAAVTTTLEREGVKAESHALVEPALRRCSDAADQLLFAADKVKKEEPQLSAALAKLRVLGRRAVYPFKKDTISGLSGRVLSVYRRAIADLAARHFRQRQALPRWPRRGCHTAWAQRLR